MTSIPRIGHLDSTLAFRANPYRFISTHCKRLQSDLFQARILLQKTVCMTGRSAVVFFVQSSRRNFVSGALGGVDCSQAVAPTPRTTRKGRAPAGFFSAVSCNRIRVAPVWTRVSVLHCFRTPRKSCTPLPGRSRCRPR